MALDIPNEVSANFAPQAAVDSTDLDAIVAGVGATGVLTGCAVTAPGSSGMSVAIAAGSVLIGGTSVSVSSVAGLTIGAAGASDRKDMIVVNNAGTVSVVAGGSSGAVNGVTPSGSRDPVKGSIPANSVVLAEVYVATTTASLTTAANVVDKRVFVGGYAPGNPPPYPVTTVAGRTGTVTLTAADVLGGSFPTASLYVFQPNGGPQTSYNPPTFNTGLTLTPQGAATATNVVVDTAFTFNYQYWTGSASATGGVSVKATALNSAGAAGLVVGGTLNSTGNLSEAGNRVYSAGNAPPYPVTSVAGRTGTVSIGASDVVAGTFPGGTFVFQNGVNVAQNVQIGSGNALTDSAGTGSRSIGFPASAGQWSTDTAGTNDIVVRAANGGTIFFNTNAGSGVSTMNVSPTAVTLPSGIALVTGTRAVYTGTRATTTNASDTVNLGTFTSTGGAMELVIHAQLAAPAAGTTASVTKVYEFSAGALMGTLNTWYLVLPVDASANAAASNDFALEVQRTNNITFSFRFRQKTIGVAGSITFTVETLGDTAVTFTPSTTVTAAPAAVSTLHPSNAFTAAAGNVGIGTESPGFLLDVNGTLDANTVQENGNRVYSSANANLSSTTPAAVASAGAVGTGTTYARADHAHLGYSSTNANLSATTPAAVASAGAVGTGTTYARADHAHSGVTTVATRAGAVTLTAADIGSGTFPAGTFNVSGTLQEAGSRVYTAATAPTAPVQSNVATQETTASTTYVGLTTADTVSLTVPPSGSVLIHFNAQMANSAVSGQSFMTPVVTDTTNSTTPLAAADNNAAFFTAAIAGQIVVIGRTVLVTGMTAGHSITVKLNYRVTANTGTFVRRMLIVQPTF